MKIKSYRKLALIGIFAAFAPLHAQYKVYQPGSLQETYAILSNKDALNGFRYYPQTPELLNTITKSNRYTNTGEQITLLPPLRTRKASEYFYYNHPEYNGRIRAGLGSKNWVQRLGKNTLLKTPTWFYSYMDDAGSVSSNTLLNPKSYDNYLVVNPIVDFVTGPPAAFGRQQLNNGRGAEVFGKVGGRVAFTSQVYEAQIRPQQYVQSVLDSFGTIPGVGFWMGNAWNYSDFIMARGSVHTNLVNSARDNSHVLMSFGHDQQFVGYGYRSLILSNFSPSTAYLRFNTKIGPFSYQNIFKELTVSDGLFSGSEIKESKYLAAHRGSLDLGESGIEIGFNEMIVHHRPNGGFDLNYLNPIIFYRSIERDLGSGDNALLAFDARWKRRNFTYYLQLLVDEFNARKIYEGKDWSNKQGYQLGFYYQPNLPEYGDLLVQVEFNSVRPYTYAHFDQYTNYDNFNQALAHPLGSNFREGLVRVVLKPRMIEGLTLIHTTMFAEKGFDPYIDGPNYGGNIHRSYKTRVRDNNVYMQQGEFGRILNTKTQILYELMPNMWLTLNAQYRTQSAFRKSSESYFSLGWKWNWYEETQLF